MVKVTVPGEFNALVFPTVALVRTADAHYRTMPAPKGKPVIAWLRSMRARGLWTLLDPDEYQDMLDARYREA